MRSVIPGMERLSSLVRLGPPCRRQRIVPFQTAIHQAHHRVHRTLGDFFFADWHFTLYTDKYDSTLTSDSIHNRLGVMEHFTSNKHLPRLFAQALNEKRIELFDEFIHPEYNNHNPQVQPGPAGVQALRSHPVSQLWYREMHRGSAERMPHQRPLHLRRNLKETIHGPSAEQCAGSVAKH